MNKKGLLITLIVLLVVIGVAATLYPKLSTGLQPQQMATMPDATTEPVTEAPVATEAATEETTAATEETTVATEETTAATEAPEPQPVPAPDFIVQDWDGNEVHLSDYFGKPIVLNFWAHWCDACQYQMPEFNAVWEELDGEVTFLMNHVGPEVDKGKEKVTENGYTFPVIFDNERAAADYYGIGSYPTTIFINAEGHIKAYYIGAMNRDLLMHGIELIRTPEE